MSKDDAKILREIKNRMIGIVNRDLAADETLLLISQILHKKVIERKIEDFTYDFYPHYKAFQWIDVRIMLPSDLFKWHSFLVKPGQSLEEDPYEAYDRAMKIL